MWLSTSQHKLLLLIGNLVGFLRFDIVYLMGFCYIMVMMRLNWREFVMRLLNFRCGMTKEKKKKFKKRHHKASTILMDRILRSNEICREAPEAFLLFFGRL